MLVRTARQGSIATREAVPLVSNRNPGTLLARMADKGLLSRMGRRGGTRYVLSPTTIRGAGRPPIRGRGCSMRSADGEGFRQQKE